MEIGIIASGSKGNSCYIKAGNTKLIIDAGISKKRIISYLEENNIEPNISGVMVTHEHVDHISGLTTLMKELECPLYVTRGTYDGILKKNGSHSLDCVDVRFIGQNEEFNINDVVITALPTSHDANEPNGYMIEHNEKKVVYITDTGYIRSDLLPIISNADIYVMETNHDPELLMACEKRPYFLKQRIIGDEGHMSNEDAIYNLCHIISQKTKIIFYAHISEDCNLNEIISSTAKKIYNEMGMDVSDIEFIYTSQIPSKVYSL